MPKTFVIIVTYNAMKWTERCFSSLRKSSVPVKTIVVDNGSTDGTQDYIKNNFPEVDFIQSEENLGFGKANNLGIEKAYKQGADFFYLMNQDAWIFEDSFEKMLDVYNKYPNKDEIGIISPMHLDGSEKKLDIFFENYLARNAVKNNFLSDAFTHDLKKFYEVDFINAAHWLLPKHTILQIGGFNPYFFHYSEDYEYVQRVRFFNKKILVAPESRVVHDGKQDWGKTDHINMRRVQREQRYLDPSNNFSKKIMQQEFWNDIVKLGARGKLSSAKYFYREYNYQKQRVVEIEEARRKISINNPSFLNI